MNAKQRILQALHHMKRPAIFLGLMAGLGAVFYLVPSIVLTLGFGLTSFVTGILLVCMLQSNMIDSSLGFRLAIAGLAAGCFAGAITPFMHGYHIGPWGFLKAAALLAVVILMRIRQVKTSGRPACVGPALQH